VFKAHIMKYSSNSLEGAKRQVKLPTQYPLSLITHHTGTVLVGRGGKESGKLDMKRLYRRGIMKRHCRGIGLWEGHKGVFGENPA